jgi:hypothetical protein
VSEAQVNWYIDCRLEPDLQPVAIAPGSVFVDPTCRTLTYVSLLPYDETAVLRQTKTEPGAIATGLKFEDTQLVTTKKFLLLGKFV